MGTPAGFKGWKRYWFQCPRCGYRSYSAVGNVEISKDKLNLLWRFWCAKCEGIAVLRNPYLAHGLMFLCAVILFVGTYGPMNMLLSYLAPETPLIWAVSWSLVLGAVVTYLIAPLLSRFFNSYAPTSTHGL